MKTRSRFLPAFAPVLLAAAALLGARAHAGDDEGDAATLKSLATTKHSLADGIRAAAKPPAVAISAKFEDEGKGLSLSVYTAGKGLGSDADDNVLQELSGSPTSTEWKPETEVFKDVEHVARSAEQLTLMRLTKVSLLDVIAKAETLQKGTVFFVAPAVENGKGVFFVRVAAEGKVVPLTLDLMTGAPVPAK